MLVGIFMMVKMGQEEINVSGKLEVWGFSEKRIIIMVKYG